MTLDERLAFIRSHTRLQAPPHAPELKLWLADEVTPIWRMTEEELGAMGLPPPFWAFAWAGGQGLARYLLDHPHEVAGKRVLDLACGSGMVAIAAMRAGAASVLANDVDEFCEAAVMANAEANGVAVGYNGADLLARQPPDFEVICAGDICYEKPMAERARAWLAAARHRGARVLIGDPHRTYFSGEGLRPLAEYRVPTTRELEDMEIKRTGVWALD
jgi:predicted nicotinamide N-methyase